MFWIIKAKKRGKGKSEGRPNSEACVLNSSNQNFVRKTIGTTKENLLVLVTIKKQKQMLHRV